MDVTVAHAQPPASAAQRIEELGRIILAYSEVTEKLQQSHERLEQTVARLRDELSEKNRLLERRNRLAALGEMAAGMAHEIRNPLGGIQLYASMLARDVADRPQAAQTVQKIRAGVQHLESLVSQVLQFTREITPSLCAADLADVVEQAVDLAASRLADGRIQCDLRIARPFAVQVDPRLLSQAILNLVLNAADAMESGGRVTISASAPAAADEARQFVLVVEDEGPGIPPQVIDRIFNPFFTTRDTGTGLGLAIVHRIVEAHDGSISVSNRPQGGARFEIRI